ncbi:hypothetical protein F8388_017421 [Cannabis sativa]|uniref:B-like cyclin n=1 Tax=Cannabis sativa TaxID=3483 RepID=A0A7J6I2P1_CANSA|nr:hypothetical protein F8388_017421 [Cannabis sativa]KAF4401814.1 hypothetical protein G4B88_013101 [Cannabis sativa]
MAIEEDNIPAQGVTKVLEVSHDMSDPLDITIDWIEYLDMEVSNSNLSKNLHDRSIFLIEMYSKSEPFDAWILYLAANIFNLYVCREKIDHENERSIDLIALSCLSIAWKSREKDFSILMLKAKYTELHTITHNMCSHMEFQILDAIGCTPTSITIVTPINLEKYFKSVQKMKFDFNKYGALFCETIIQCQSEYWVEKLRSSLIAALAALVISTVFSSELFNMFYQALKDVQIITEDEFLSYFSEMLKAFRKRKNVKKELKAYFDFRSIGKLVSNVQVHFQYLKM